MAGNAMVTPSETSITDIGINGVEYCVPMEDLEPEAMPD